MWSAILTFDASAAHDRPLARLQPPPHMIRAHELILLLANWNALGALSARRGSAGRHCTRSAPMAILANSKPGGRGDSSDTTSEEVRTGAFVLCGCRPETRHWPGGMPESLDI